MVKPFEKFSDICFKEFGDRVKKVSVHTLHILHTYIHTYIHIPSEFYIFFINFSGSP